MNITNISAEPLGVLHSWLPTSLKAEQVVFLPDACPGRSPLPTGTVVWTRQRDWRKYAVSDCGCGMRLLKSSLSRNDLTQSLWDDLAASLRANKGQLGDLGGGNHFLDALLPYIDDYVYFLIHTGSRNESGLVDHLIDDEIAFDTEFKRVVEWARENRATVHEEIIRVFGPVSLILDLPHNTYEIQDDGSVIIRKGAVHVNPADLTVIPSHMAGDVALVKATDRINELLYSLSHGTGRKLARSDSKSMAENYDFNKLRESVLMSSSMSDASIKTEGPYAYRDLDQCLTLLEGYVEEMDRFSVIGYLGHI